MKFKKGDRIRRISQPSDYYKVGEVYTIKKYYNDQRMDILETGKNAHANYFELVESSIDQLPEKWFVRGIYDNYTGSLSSKNLELYTKILEKFPKNSGDIGFFKTCYYYLDDSNKFNWNDNLPGNYTEITFEQFKQLILNKNEQQNTKTNEVQSNVTTDSRTIGGSSIRTQGRKSTITVGNGYFGNKIISQPSKAKIISSPVTGRILSSVYN